MTTETEYSDAGHADFELRLRRELEHVSVRVPADMIPRAHRGYRRRLVTTRVTAITGTAVVIATAATVVALAGPSLSRAHGGQRPGAAASQPPAPRIPAASVRPSPPGDGLSSQQAAREISWIRSVSTSPGGATSVADRFTYGGTTRVVGFSDKGAVLGDQQATAVSGVNGTRVLAITDVDYPGGTVRQWTQPAADQEGQQALCPAPGAGLAQVSASALVASAAALLACPGLAVTRGVRIDGINAVTISSDAMDIRTTIWLSAATGMPVKETTTSDSGKGRGGADTTVQFGFLPATAANMGFLSAAVPPGFKKYTSPPAGAS
jgi:hypothetical protein